MMADTDVFVHVAVQPTLFSLGRLHAVSTVNHRFWLKESGVGGIWLHTRGSGKKAEQLMSGI